MSVRRRRRRRARRERGDREGRRQITGEQCVKVEGLEGVCSREEKGKK